MAQHVVTSALMVCTFGTAPSSFVATSKTILSNSLDAGNIMDYKPNTNIPPFGMCSSLLNPTVASATSAASGVLTPQACTPNTQSPWVPGALTVLSKDQPSLNNTSCLNCGWGGVITFTSPGQVTETIP